jgi:Uma2 family endonuclease
VEIVWASNALPKLREKALAYVIAGAMEAWIVHPHSHEVEIYAREGRRQTTSFPVNTASLFT